VKNRKENKRTKKMNDALQSELETMHRSAGKAPALKDPEFRKRAKKAAGAIFAPYVVDGKGKAHAVKPLGLNREMYVVDTSKKTRSRVVDKQDKVDVDFKGSTLLDEVGTPYYSERHGEPMRVMRTIDGSTVAFPQSAVVPVSRRTRRSYAIGAAVSQKRFNEIFKARRAKS